MSARKPHNDVAGYVCERRHPYTKGHVLIVDVRNGGRWAASEDGGGRYVVICDPHGTLVQDTSRALGCR